MPEAFRRLQALLTRRPGGDREMVEILALVLHHDEQAVLCAVEMALAAGVPTKTHILNLLHRLVDGKAPTVPPINAPQALSLTREPRADVERYDTLRRKGMRQVTSRSGVMIPPALPSLSCSAASRCTAWPIGLRHAIRSGLLWAVGDLIEQGAPAFTSAIPILSQLLKAEMAEREVRSIAYQIKAARFPAYKDLAGFDFASSEVNEAMVRQLHAGAFIDGADNIVLAASKSTQLAQAQLLSAREPARPTLLPRLASRLSSIIARRCGSSQPLISSMRSSRRRPRTRPGNWPSVSSALTS